MRIAVIVHGRFHAFDLSRELLRLGHDVTVFTNYPAFVAVRWGIPARRVCSFLAHGVASRLARRLFPRGLGGALERMANLVFGRWAARQVLACNWDAVVAFSGVAEETFRALAGRGILRVLERGSAHIAVQRRILRDEETRVGFPIEKPSGWIVARESREYRLADVIHVLSGFAERSFLEEGILPGKLFRLELGVNTKVFRATPEVIEQRCRRILSGEPLRVLNVGTFCCRKGAWDLEALINYLGAGCFRFRFVGPVAADASALAKRMSGWAEFLGKIPQDELPGQYAWGDLFLLPTLEDGFAMVLTQALAAGLPLLTTPNCGGPDLIREGQTGWVVPVRDPEALVSRLHWCHQQRAKFAEIVREAYSSWRDLDWGETARQAEHHLSTLLSRK